MPRMGHVATGRVLKRPPSVPALTHALTLFLSLALALVERNHSTGIAVIAPLSSLTAATMPLSNCSRAPLGHHLLHLADHPLP